MISAQRRALDDELADVEREIERLKKEQVKRE